MDNLALLNEHGMNIPTTIPTMKTKSAIKFAKIYCVVGVYNKLTDSITVKPPALVIKRKFEDANDEVAFSFCYIEVNFEHILS